MARNRVIYQSEALFVSPDATGAHFSCSALQTGMGPTGTNPTQAIPKDPNNPGSGNALGYLTFLNPIGLRQDPALLKDSRVTNNEELAYLSGAAAAAIYSYVTGLTGTSTSTHPFYQGTPNKWANGLEFDANGNGAIANKTDVNELAGITGLNVYDNTQSWEEALSGYWQDGRDANTVGIGVSLQPWNGTYENLVQQVHRVQSANYSFTINRTDVNVFGQLARIDAIALEPPTVNLDFSYYPTDGFNERVLNFYVRNVNDSTRSDIGNAALNHVKADTAGQNFFILTTPENTDAFNTTVANIEKSVIGLGNGYLSDYSLEASVGSIPTVSSTVELFNAKSDVGTTGVAVPSINLEDGTPITGINFTLGHASGNRGDVHGANPSTGEFGASALTVLRPGDIKLEFPDELGFLTDLNGDGSAHVQSFNLSLPLSRTPIDRIGSRYAFARVVDLPVVATMSVNAVVSEIGTGNLANILDDCGEYDVRVTLKGQTPCGTRKIDALVIDFKGAKLDSESLSSDIGSNKSVDLTWTTQIGGAEDLIHGVFISGANRSDIPASAQIPGA
jgi:hypothetical protein